MYEHIPAELKALKQWVCWRAEPDAMRPGKVKKTPVNARTGGGAMSNNPDTWCNYDEAVQAVDARGLSGIGFMFAGGYFGVDIDGVQDDIQAWRESNGAPQPPNIIAEFIHTLESYAEYSQSGNGLHVICKGSLPPGGRRRGNVEMYQSGRFFIMTGNAASQYTAITDCTERIKPLHERYIGGGRTPSAGVSAQHKTLALDDKQITELAARGKSGEIFQRLYSGAWEGLYDSQSEADIRLCGMLAFYTRRNAEQMDAIFRASGLMRDKWDRRTGAATYGELTIAKAIHECQKVYEPREEYGVSIANTAEAQPSNAAQVPARLYTFDDTGNAERFVDMFGQYIRYSYVDRKWMYYDGRKWCVDLCGAVASMMDEAVESFRQQCEYYMQNAPASVDAQDYESQLHKHIKACRSNKSKTAALKETEHRVPIMPAELDALGTDLLLNTPSGVLDLRTGQLHAHSPALYISRITNVEYSEKADCPMWEAFLQDIFQDDNELIHYMQMALGYALTGSIQEQCMFFLYGTGKNGKSTFLEVVADILGDYVTNIQPTTIMVKPNPSSGASSDVARLKGARCVTCAEPNEGTRFDEGLIKQLTGGDRITTRKLYGEEFEYRSKFKLLMAGNHKPIIRGTDTGIWRRIHLIPFNATIPESKRDPNLRFKLMQEAPGILRWMVDGCLMWQQAGRLAMPLAVADAVKEYKGSMDVVGAFLDECTTDGPGSVGASDLYKAYRKWAEENGEYIMSNNKFGREVVKRYQRIKSSNAGYAGLSINPEYAPYRLKFGAN